MSTMPPLGEPERQFLLRLARQRIEEAALGRRPSQASPTAPALLQPRGAFVTLKLHGQLRGCIGNVVATQRLYLTVQECAHLAAFRDSRFEPVRVSEIPNLRIEISALSPLEEIAPEQIEIGRHGLMVSMGLRRGVLLPQVPLEWKWGRERFLEETCLKAGLAPDALRHGARIEAFTTEVFSEPQDPVATHPSRSALPF